MTDTTDTTPSTDTTTSTLPDVRVAFLGAGQMGGAILSGMLDAGLRADSVVVTAASEETRSRWTGRGVRATTDNAEAARGARVVVLGVKPYAIAQVLDEIAEELTPGTIVVSLAAGVRIETLEAHAGDGVPVLRVMPNTPALVRQGVFVVTTGSSCGEEELEMVRALLSTCGVIEVVPEKMQNAASALSGSGPAYAFYVVDALVEGAVLEGLPRPVALRLAARTLAGAAALLESGEDGPSVLRERVTSPGGSTAAALRALDAGAVRHHLGVAISAATEKNARLGG